MEYGEVPGNFDVTIVNDNLDAAYKQARQQVPRETIGAQRVNC